MYDKRDSVHRNELYRPGVLVCSRPLLHNQNDTYAETRWMRRMPKRERMPGNHDEVRLVGNALKISRYAGSFAPYEFIITQILCIHHRVSGNPQS